MLRLRALLHLEDVEEISLPPSSFAFVPSSRRLAVVDDENLVHAVHDGLLPSPPVHVRRARDEHQRQGESEETEEEHRE